MMKLSYVHGGSTKPLIGEAIGVDFGHTAARFADRDALIVRHQDIRTGDEHLPGRRAAEPRRFGRSIAAYAANLIYTLITNRDLFTGDTRCQAANGTMRRRIAIPDEGLSITERLSDRFYELELHWLKGEPTLHYGADRRNNVEVQAEESYRKALQVAEFNPPSHGRSGQR